MSTENKTGYMVVTFRIKQGLYAEYRKAMIDSQTTPTEDLVEHINAQVENYILPESSTVEIDNEEYVKVNFRVLRDLYAEYKKVLIDARTNSTADIKRHMLRTVEAYHNAK